MIEGEQLYDLALQLIDQPGPLKLTKRQFDCWHAHRFLGMDLRDAAAFLRRRENGEYDIHKDTVMCDSRYAHEIVVQAVKQVEEGPVRFAHSVHAGSEVWDVQDDTLQQVAHRMRIVLPKKKHKTEEFCSPF